MKMNTNFASMQSNEASEKASETARRLRNKYFIFGSVELLNQLQILAANKKRIALDWMRWTDKE